MAFRFSLLAIDFDPRVATSLDSVVREQWFGNHRSWGL